MPVAFTAVFSLVVVQPDFITVKMPVICLAVSENQQIHASSRCSVGGETVNITKKLTVRHLKNNMKRTVFTCAGIAISAAMVTAVLMIMSTFLQFYADVSVYSYGNNHAEFYSISQNDFKNLQNDDRVLSCGRCLNYYYDIVEIGSSAIDMSMYAFDETAMEMSVTSKYEGTLPQKENEIAADRIFLEQAGIKNPKVGDKIKVTFSDEKSNKTKQTFVLSAILEGNYPTMGRVLRRMTKQEENEQFLDAKLTLKTINHNSLNVLNELEDSLKDGCAGMNYNSSMFDSHLALGENSFIFQALVPTGMFIIIIIMIASVTMIHNSFSMSLAEKIRYLGMLASVGATKKQKRDSILFEGFILGSAGIVLGCIFGALGMGITLKILGERITGVFAEVYGVQGFSVGFKITVSPLLFACAIAVCSVIVFISSLIPAVKASKITPIDAIRQNTQIKVSARKLRTNRLTGRIFGFEGVVADKNIKRGGRKSRILILSVVVSCSVFLVCSYFSQFVLDIYEVSRTVTDLAAGLSEQSSQEIEYVKAIIYFVKVLVYGFITLISLISVTNIVNTVSSSLLSRRRESAMYRSVGMTQKGLMKSITIESFLYVFKALIFALPLGAVLSYILYRLPGLMLDFNYTEMLPFKPNWVVYAVVILAVILIIGASVLSSVKKIEKDTIVDVLKEDIS